MTSSVVSVVIGALTLGESSGVRRSSCLEHYGIRSAIRTAYLWRTRVVTDTRRLRWIPVQRRSRAHRRYRGCRSCRRSEPVGRVEVKRVRNTQDPHWTETRQQQMLHEARIPPRPLSPTRISPVDDIKRRLERITDIHDNLKKSYDQARSKIRTIAAPVPPTGPPKATPSVSHKLAWSLPIQSQFRTTTLNPKPSQKPFRGPPPLAPPPRPSPRLPQNPNPIGIDEGPLQGKEPPVFEGD